jgi:outer membrane protein OmpA-like peptidoglycan-associated protein/ABC-type nitrate/sulfonate/bicarbonate transport system substrate-binding protein
MARGRIKWGNILILFLIIAAGVAAFYYKNPDLFKGIGNGGTVEAAQTSQESSPPKAEGTLQENGAADTRIAEDGAKPASDAFVLGLDSWIGGTPALIALNREYNRDYSLNLQLKYITNDRDRITALKNGEIHATEMTLPAFLRFQKEFPDSGVVLGFTDFSRGADGIIARSNIGTLNDMEGKKVSYVSDGIGKFILNKFLRLTGLRYQDIIPVERKEMSEVIEDLKTGRADLAVSWSPDMNLAVKEINAAQPDSARLLITTKEVPDLVPTVLVANRAVAEKYPKKVDAFLKTWYVSAKYILEKPDKAYAKLAELMAENEDIYGGVTAADVKDSFEHIKLMSLNDNFSYFGLNGDERKIDAIISDTVKTWQKYGDMDEDGVPSGLVADSFQKALYEEKDEELLVDALDSNLTGNAARTGEEAKEFKAMDAASVDKNTEKVAKVDIPPVYYDSGKAAVKKESLSVLNEVVSVLKQFPEYYLIIDAHTDSEGSSESNLKLSRDRAETVRAYLVSQKIDPNRLIARGWGESRLLVADEKTEEDRAKNRRTEFILTREAAAE